MEIARSERIKYILSRRTTHTWKAQATEKVIAVIGVENVVVVDTPDALLVADRARSEDVKLVVEALKAGADVALTELPATVHRPWGTYVTLRQEEGLSG